MCLFNEVLFWFQNVLHGFCISLVCITRLQRVLITSDYQCGDVKGPRGAEAILEQTERKTSCVETIWSGTYYCWDFSPGKTALLWGFILEIGPCPLLLVRWPQWKGLFKGPSCPFVAEVRCSCASRLCCSPAGTVGCPRQCCAAPGECCADGGRGSGTAERRGQWPSLSWAVRVVLRHPQLTAGVKQRDDG